MATPRPDPGMASDAGDDDGVLSDGESEVAAAPVACTAGGSTLDLLKVVRTGSDTGGSRMSSSISSSSVSSVSCTIPVGALAAVTEILTRSIAFSAPPLPTLPRSSVMICTAAVPS